MLCPTHHLIDVALCPLPTPYAWEVECPQPVAGTESLLPPVDIPHDCPSQLELAYLNRGPQHHLLTALTTSGLVGSCSPSLPWESYLALSPVTHPPGLTLEVLAPALQFTLGGVGYEAYSLTSRTKDRLGFISRKDLLIPGLCPPGGEVLPGGAPPHLLLHAALALTYSLGSRGVRSGCSRASYE